MTQEKPFRKLLDLDAIFAAEEQPLSLIENADRRAEIQRFLQASHAHVERAVFDLLSETAAAVQQGSSNTHVHLEYEAGKIYIAVEPSGEQEEEAEGHFRSDDDVERVTVRLPARLKALVDKSASARGMSVNRWYVRTVARAIYRQERGWPAEEPFMPRGLGGRRGQREITRPESRRVD